MANLNFVSQSNSDHSITGDGSLMSPLNGYRYSYGGSQTINYSAGVSGTIYFDFTLQDMMSSGAMGYVTVNGSYLGGATLYSPGTSLSGTSSINSGDTLVIYFDPGSDTSHMAYFIINSIYIVSSGTTTTTTTLAPNIIKPKRSYTLGNTPTLSASEIAINAASPAKIWIGSEDGMSNVLVGSMSLADMTGTAATATNISGGGAGQVPYNTGSGATSFLGAGTSGQILRSNGTSAPTWESQGLFSGGRLTLSSGVPVPTTDISSSTIYYTPYNGDKISLFDYSQRWSTYTFTQLSLSLGTLTSGKNYDVFLYNNAGTLTLELSAAWTSDTVRSNALTLLNGVYVKSGLPAITTNQRRYLGTFRATSTTTTASSKNNRLLWNLNNQVELVVHQDTFSTYGYGGHTYTTSAWRAWNNDANQRIGYVVGLDRGISVGFGSAGGGYTSQGAAWDGATPGYDSVDVNARAGRTYSTRSNVLGYHYVTMMEFGSSGTTYIQGILEGTFWC